MELLEKQQNIEAIRTVVKARWYYASIIFAQGVILRLFFPKVPLAGTPTLSFILFTAFIFNFGYWLYLRRSAEKMSTWGIQTVKAMQVMTDHVWISAILYFSGTIGKMVVLLYFVAIMIGATLYRRKGVIFSVLFAQFLFTILAILQYKGLMGLRVPVTEIFGVEFAVGNKQWLYFVLVAFYSYSTGAAVFAGYLAELFRKREKGLREQRDKLTEQTQQLTQAKDELQSALAKSDISRQAATRARDDIEKANVELKGKMGELERFYRVTVGREVKMAEMKKRIKELEGKKEKKTS